MSLFAFMGGLETGLLYAFVALAVYFSFRILDFPDLTVDGTFPFGAAMTATLIASGCNPWIATLCGMLMGSLGGMATAYFSTRWNILHLLASILTMTALYSINIRTMGGVSNLSIMNAPTVLTPFYGLAKAVGMPDMFLRPLVLFGILGLVYLMLVWFLYSEVGLAMRATGANRRMARAQGVGADWQVIGGMMLSNALVGLAGSLYAQINQAGDTSIGPGTIVIGLASVIIGETLLPSRRIWVRLLASIIGAVVFRMVTQMALEMDVLGLQAFDLNLVTAVIVLCALCLPKLKQKVFA